MPRLLDSGLGRIPFLLSQSFYPQQEVKIFYFGETPPEKSYLDFAAPVQKISLFSFCSELNNYDIVHSHGMIPDVYLAIYANKIKGVKITTLHGYHIEELSYQTNKIRGWLLGNLWDYACSRLDLVVCLTKTMQDYYQQKINARYITFIYNGVDCSSLYPLLEQKKQDAVKKSGEKIKLVTISILNRRKGVDQVIKLLAKNKNCSLTGIGGLEEYITSLNLLAENLGVGDRLQLFGFDKNPWETAIEGDVFIFPSHSEGHPLSLLEAAHLELPIVCSDIPTFREMFTEDEVTFFKLNDIENLNEKIINLQDIAGKVSRAKLKVESQFNIKNMADNYYQMYLNMLQTRETTG
ncbi:MAG: glycosyltransferase family 4 protein [Microcystaceae cyanobacterium]